MIQYYLIGKALLMKQLKVQWGNDDCDRAVNSGIMNLKNEVGGNCITELVVKGQEDFLG